MPISARETQSSPRPRVRLSASIPPLPIDPCRVSHVQSHAAAELHGACRWLARRAAAHRERRMTAASRRAVLRALASATSVLALGGCARLAGPSVQLDVADLSVNPMLLVATTRKPVEDG